MSGTNGPQWLTTTRSEDVVVPAASGPATTVSCDIVTFDFVDVGATISINLSLREVVVNWNQIVSTGPGASKQVYVADVNPDGSRPRWSTA